ncbi:hypothetical protein Gotur_020799 [Gossypium turneri]
MNEFVLVILRDRVEEERRFSNKKKDPMTSKELNKEPYKALLKDVEKIIEHDPMETRRRAKKASRSRDMLSSLKNWVVNLEESIGNMKETLELVMSLMKDLRGDSKEFVWDTLKSTSDKLTASEEIEDNTKSFSAILGGAKYRANNGLIFVDIIMAGRGLNALVDTGASDLFMFKEMAKKLKIEKDSDRIKIVNSKSVPITGVAKGVELDLAIGLVK